MLLIRIVSKLNDHPVYVNLGYKSIASKMPHPRAQFLNLSRIRELGCSEEHLFIETDSSSLEVGDLLYVLRRHICPTVALHDQVVVVENGTAIDTWQVVARKRSLTF